MTNTGSIALTVLRTVSISLFWSVHAFAFDPANAEYPLGECTQFQYVLPLVRLDEGRLHVGGRESASDGADISVYEDAVLRGDLTGDGAPEWVVPLSCTGGGANYDINEYFIVDGKSEKFLARVDHQHLEHAYNATFGSAGYGDSVQREMQRPRIEGEELVLNGYAEGVHACPAFRVEFRYRLDKGNLVLASAPKRSENTCR
jgi:hypothetical protein